MKHVYENQRVIINGNYVCFGDVRVVQGEDTTEIAMAMPQPEPSLFFKVDNAMNELRKENEALIRENIRLLNLQRIQRQQRENWEASD